jgi:hypothetical protein
MTGRPHALGLLAVTALAAIALPARALPAETDAAPPAARSEPTATITVSGICPKAEAIWTAMASLVPVKELDRLDPQAKIDVSDLGDTYRVTVNAKGTERLRIYRDLAHDCDHRARFAAVFIVLTLMPPEVLLDALPAPPPEPPPPPPPPPAEPPHVVLVPAPPPVARRRIRLELSALADLAPRSGSRWAAALGGELRVAPGPNRAGPVAAVGVAGGPIDLGGLSATEIRLPFDLGLRLPIVSRTSIDLVADLGLAGALFRDRATDTIAPQSGTRLDLGARAALVAHQGAERGRLLKIIGLHAELYPRPYDVTLLPQGTVGRTPVIWFGVTLGLAVQP